MVELLYCVSQNAGGEKGHVWLALLTRGGFESSLTAWPSCRKNDSLLIKLENGMFYWLVNSGPTEKCLSGCFNVSWALSFR